MSSEIPSLGLRWPGQVSSLTGPAQRPVLETIRIGSESWNGGVVARDDEGRMERRAGEFERGEDRGGSFRIEGRRRLVREDDLGTVRERAGGRDPLALARRSLVRGARGGSAHAESRT